jgi:hypothetical protein
MRLVHGMIAATVAVSAALTPVAPALAQTTPSQGANAELLEFCYDLIASGDFPDLNLGECMSFNIVPEQGFAAHFCDFLRETDQLGDVTYAECVRNL